MKYRRKQTEVEVFVFTNDAEVIAPEWFVSAVADGTIWIDRTLKDGHMHIYGCTIHMPEGKLHAKLGDYIICDEGSKIYPCRKQLFQKMYERADER